MNLTLTAMDNIIHRAAKGGFEHCLVDIENVSAGRYYFFFRQELDVPGIASGDVAKDIAAYADLKRTTIRHAIPNKRKIFDYVVGKHYPTLRDWATANGRSVDDIIYGVNHVHFGQYHQRAWIDLNDLLTTLQPKWVWPAEDIGRHKYDLEDILYYLAQINQYLGKVNDRLRIITQI